MADAHPRAITVEDVARIPAPGTAVPTAIAFSPDDRWVTWLHAPDRGLVRELFAVDTKTGETRRVLSPPSGGDREENLSLEEKLRRERAREHGLGVTAYAWAEKGDVILVPQSDGIYVQDGIDGELRRVVEARDHPLLDPKLSPDGGHVAYVLDDEVHVVPTDGRGPHRQLTAGARGTGKSHGLAEFVAQEEMDRSSGYWWSPDGQRVAFCEVDERHIPLYRIVHQGSDAVGRGAEEDHRYPFAGGENANVRVAVIDVHQGEPVWLDLGDYEYVARVDWHRDGRLFVQVEDRLQATLRLIAVEPATHETAGLLTETSDVWINLHDLFRPLDGGAFLWASDRTGHRHLEVRDRNGVLVRVLTEGEWQVESVAAVGEGTVWFTATKDSPLERHLYAVPLGGGDVRRVTGEPGTHVVVVDHGLRRFVDTWSALGQPPVVRLCSLDDGTVLQTLFDEPDPTVAELGLLDAAPELYSLDVDGVTLHAALWRPDGEGPFPTVVSVYGGPHVQRVTNAWAVTARLREQLLREMGYLVVTLDNRGSWGRGLAFEGAIRHDAGTVEVADQVAAVRHLADVGLVDPGRVAIYGWSYGGYMASMALAREPEVFSAAVAGAPVTAWDGYDTHYTERYMGLPSDNADGYRRAAVMTHVDSLRGDLLLVHGLIDENVHFRHTARLVNALIRARKRYELLLFPDERHSPRSEADRVYMEERILEFLMRTVPPTR